MRKITVTCNNPFDIIKNHGSTVVFLNILKEIWVDNIDELIWIFNKIKTLRPITTQEEQIISEVIKSNEFKLGYEKIKQNLEFSRKNKENLDFDNLLEEFNIFITKCRVVEILEVQNEYDVEKDWKIFTKLKINEKYVILEIVDRFEDYFIWIDVISRRYKVVNEEENTVLLKTKDKISFDKTKELNSWIFLIWEEKNYFCCNNFDLRFSKDSEIYDSHYSTFIIDWKKNLIYQIDKKSDKLTTVELFWNILDFNNWFLLYFINPIGFKWKHNEKFVSDWTINFYDISKNKDIFQNIHLKYFEFIWNNFIAFSFDKKYIYYFDLRVKIFKEINISDIPNLDKSLIDDELWKKCKSYVLKH